MCSVAADSACLATTALPLGPTPTSRYTDERPVPFGGNGSRSHRLSCKSSFKIWMLSGSERPPPSLRQALTAGWSARFARMILMGICPGLPLVRCAPNLLLHESALFDF